MRINSVASVMPKMPVIKRNHVKQGNQNNVNSPSFGFELKITEPPKNIQTAIAKAMKQNICSEEAYNSFIKKVNDLFAPYLSFYKNETLILHYFDGVISNGEEYNHKGKKYCENEGFVRFFIANASDPHHKYSGVVIPLQIYINGKPDNENAKVYKLDDDYKKTCHMRLAECFMGLWSFNEPSNFNKFIDYGMQNEKGDIPLETKKWVLKEYEEYGLVGDWKDKKDKYNLFVNYMNHEDEPQETREWVWNTFEEKLSPEEAIIHFPEIGIMKQNLLGEGQNFSLEEFAKAYRERHNKKEG